MRLETGGLGTGVSEASTGMLEGAPMVALGSRHPSLPGVSPTGLSPLGGGSTGLPSGADETGMPTTELEKRMRREIANSNERRRMQSINVGFQSLRALLPKRDGEKMSKASILAQTADYVVVLQKEKDSLVRENTELKALLEGRTGTAASLPTATTLSPMSSHPGILAPPKKRRRFESNPPPSSHTDSSSDEGTASTGEPASPKAAQLLSPAAAAALPTKAADLRPGKDEQIELRAALERETATRKLLEDQLRTLEISRLQSIRSLQPALLDYTSLLAATPYSLGLLPPPPGPPAPLPPPKTEPTSCPMTTIAHPSPIKPTPTLLLGGTSSLSPSTVSSLYSSMLASSAAGGMPAPLAIPTIPAGPGLIPTSGPPTSKQSLEVIVEAIRHLEGDSAWAGEGGKLASPHRPDFASPLGRAPVIVPN